MNKNEVKGKLDLDYVKRFIKDPEFVKYAKYVLGFMAIEGTHEGLSYFKGKPGQFYEKPAKFSLVGYSRKRKLEKERASKIKEFGEAAQCFGNYYAYALINPRKYNWRLEYSSGKVRVSQPIKLGEGDLGTLNINHVKLSIEKKIQIKIKKYKVKIY